MKNISELDVTDAEAFALIVVFNLLMFIMVEVPLVGFVVAPEWARRIATGFNTWLAQNLRRIAIYALVIGGVVELVRGVVAALT